eukprot:4949957-Pleurochrysis_carterae.AAC.1
METALGDALRRALQTKGAAPFGALSGMLAQQLVAVALPRMRRFRLPPGTRLSRQQAEWLVVLESPGS